MANSNDAFWIVWNPDNHRAPKYRHDTFRAADSEAKRLARENPGCEFIVMGSCRSVKVANLIVTDFTSDADIPF